MLSNAEWACNSGHQKLQDHRWLRLTDKVTISTYDFAITVAIITLSLFLRASKAVAEETLSRSTMQ